MLTVYRFRASLPGQGWQAATVTATGRYVGTAAPELREALVLTAVYRSIARRLAARQQLRLAVVTISRWIAAPSPGTGYKALGRAAPVDSRVQGPASLLVTYRAVRAEVVGADWEVRRAGNKESAVGQSQDDRLIMLAPERSLHDQARGNRRRRGSRIKF